MLQRVISCLFLLLLLAQCASYKQNIMFKTDSIVPDQIQEESLRAEKNYIIKKNDILTLEVAANNGEKLVEPVVDPTLSNPVQSITTTNTQYTVTGTGTVRLPLVGEIALEGLSLQQAESILQKEYAKFYTSPFVRLRFTNKRVIVLGSPGGQVLPLPFDNISLAEVLAMAEGLDNLSKADNIRVIRGNQVFVVDFSTIEGYRKGNLIIQPGDVVYVEPIRRPVTESLQANSFLFVLMTSLVALIAILKP